MEIDEFVVEVVDLDSSVLVIVRGDVDMVSASRVRTALGEVAVTSDVVIDCAGLLFIDSSGLDLLDEEVRRRESSGGSLRLRNCGYPARQVVELTGLIGLFDNDDGDGAPDLGSLTTAACVGSFPKVHPEAICGSGVRSHSPAGMKK